jgi:TPR repeat protein
VSSLSKPRSGASDQAETGKSTFWRAIKAGRASAAGAGSPRRVGPSTLASALSRAAFAGPLKDANAALERGDYATAYTLARPLADRGLAVAQLVLGVMYGGGHGVPHDDAEAANWLRRAAEQGRPEAQTLLGVMYAKGQGVTRNDAKAALWFRKAADQGHAAAQSNLGLMYAKGRGVAQDDAEAAAWFRKAADGGLAEARTIVGLLYVRGQGMTQNYVLAHMWFNLAAAQGDTAALANRDQLARMMTPAQVAEAQRLAQERAAQK